MYSLCREERWKQSYKMSELDVENQILYYKKYLEKYLQKTPEQIKILHVFKKLKRLKVTLQHLHDTGIGKIVNSYRKHEGDIGPKAKELIHQWKGLVPVEEDDSIENANQPETPQQISERRSTKDSVSSREQSPEQKHRNKDSKSVDRASDGESNNKSDQSRDKFKDSKSVDRASDGESNNKSGQSRDKFKDSKESKEDRCEKSSRKSSSNHSNEKSDHRKSHDKPNEQSQSRSKSGEHSSHRKYDTQTSRDFSERKSEEELKSRKSGHSRDKSKEPKQSKQESGYSNDKSDRRRSQNEKPYEQSKSKSKSEEKLKSHEISSSKASKDRERSRHSDEKSDKYHNINDRGLNDKQKKHDRSSSERKSYTHEKSREKEYKKTDKHYENEEFKKQVKDSQESKMDYCDISKSKESKLSYVMTMDTSEAESDSVREHDSLTAKIENFRERLNGDFDIFKEEKKSHKEHSKPTHHPTSEKRKEHKKELSEDKEIEKMHSFSEDVPVNKKEDRHVNFVDEEKHESDKESQGTEEGNNGMSFEDMLLGLNTSVPKKKNQTEVISKTSHESKKDKHNRDKSKHSSDKYKHSKEKDSEKQYRSNSKSESSNSKSERSESKNSKESSSRQKSKHHSSSGHGSKDKSSSSHHNKDKHGSSHHGKDKRKSESKKRKADTELEVPIPSKEIKLCTEDIAGTLPEISPNYKPLPHLPIGFTSPHKKMEDIDDHMIAAKKVGRTAVYSGRKNFFLTSVPRLYDACLRVLMDNVDYLDYVGGVPFDILEPVLKRCTAMQLFRIEDANPTFIQDSGELWKKHCQKDFKSCKPDEDECETWRELYLRKYDERESKLKKLTANIVKSKQQAQPVKKTVLAYVDGPAKAPRDVRRRQIVHGTAGPSKVDPLAKLSSHNKDGQSKAPKVPIPKPEKASPRKQTKTVAPMMMKSLKLMKNWKTHRK